MRDKRTLFFTGNGGDGIALAAAVTASVAAQRGLRTLLASTGPSHSLSALLNVPVSDTPGTVAPNLDVWTLDVFKSMGDYLDRIRPRLFGVLARISGEELPSVPALDLFLSLEYLFQQTSGESYDLMVIDAGAHDALLRALAVPDGFRWFLRLVFGLDRGPGRSLDTLNNALISANLLPFEWLGQLQDVRVRLEQLRDEAIDLRHATVRYVLRPDVAALDEAYIAIPALHMQGLVVDGLIAGPLLPTTISDPDLAAVVENQQTVVASAEESWNPRPVLRLPVTPVHGIAALSALGEKLYNHYNPSEVYHAEPAIATGSSEEGTYVALNLPGLRAGTLSLTLSYDELVVRTGPYRRHILLPEGLRGTTNIKATRDGSIVTVRRRQ